MGALPTTRRTDAGFWQKSASAPMVGQMTGIPRPVRLATKNKARGLFACVQRIPVRHNDAE